MRRKISVIGAGFVGSTTAQRLAEKGWADIVLVDIVEGMPQGKALDLLQAGALVNSCACLTGSNDYAAMEGSELVVVTAGVARKPGMSRDDLLRTNAAILKTVAEKIYRHCPQAFVVVVSNPLDAMAYVLLKGTGFPRERVIGMAGVLDSARLRCFIAQELGVAITDVQAMVLGSHGDTMVPVARYCSVSGIPLSELLPADRIDRLMKRTRDGGAEIVSLLKTGSAYYAPSAAAVEMAEAILLDQKRILPCSVFLRGEYGLSDVFVGVPVKLGARGLEEILTVALKPEEQSALVRSADAVRELQKLTGM